MVDFLDELPLEGRRMLTMTRQVTALYVDRSCQQWVVRDPEGNFWLIPSGENCWAQRQPFCPTDAMDLEPVPGHYKCMLGLPF